jgi:hypothetical protein
MAIPGEVIAIESVTALDNYGRFNTIKFTFTGATTLAQVKMYDNTLIKVSDGVYSNASTSLLSVLYNVSSDVEYAIQTGETIDTYDFFPMPPRPVHIIEFIPVVGVKVSPSIVVSNIRVGTRTSRITATGMDLVLQEVKDIRFSSRYTQYIVGGTPSEWPRNNTTGIYYQQYEPHIGVPPAPDTVGGNQFDYISHASTDLLVVEGMSSTGEPLPVIGNNPYTQQLNLGLIGTAPLITLARGIN